MRNISFKQLLTTTGTLLAIVPAGVVAVGTEGCPPGEHGYLIGDQESFEKFTNSLYQRLGGGAKLSVNGYSSDASNGNFDVLAGYGNKQATNELFSKRKVVVVQDHQNAFGVGVSKRSDAEAAAYLDAASKVKATNSSGTKYRRNLEGASKAPETQPVGDIDDSGIETEDILRFDFGGFQIKSLGIRISDLPKGESGMYRAYLEGKKVMESMFQGEDPKGFVEFTIQGNILFDTIEFTSNMNSSGYLISYMEYCKTQICTGKTGEVWGDPHVESYDGLDWNCQGAGIFYLLDGVQGNQNFNNFKIQAHFDKSPWSDEGQISVTRAIAIDSGEPGVPVVQLTTPWNEKTNQCKDFKFYVNGVETPIESGAGRDDKVSVEVISGPEGKTYVLTYPDKGVQVSIDQWPTDDHGCLIDAGFCLGEYWKQSGNFAKGLLGGYPNDVKSDDWLDKTGNPVAINMTDRKGVSAYEFCVDNWCVKNEAESIFKFEGVTREGKPQSFAEFNKCGDANVTEKITKLQEKIENEKKDPNNKCSKMPADKIDDCLLEKIACTNPDKCVERVEKQQNKRVLKKEKEGAYKPAEYEKATKYSAGGAKTQSPTPNPSKGGANGDPHIKTWDGEKYDFHGICDLILLHNPQFYDGLGLDIHIRTKRTRSWSYISNAVVRIGGDTFEVMAKRKKNLYWVNFLPGEELIQREMTLPMTISSFPIHYKKVNSQKYEYTIDLGKGEKISIKTWNDFVRVDIIDPTVENFGDSVGLMGTFDKSLKVARDNKTVIQNLNDFGQEWQVQTTELKLFHIIDGPQAPERCEIPLKTDMRRRLGESKVSREEAELACAEVENKDEFDLCVFDVIATSDKNVAGAF